MAQIKSFKFDRQTHPVEKSFQVLDFHPYYAEDIMQNSPVYREHFYCFLLLESGCIEVSVNGYHKKICAPIVISSIPGDIWEWKNAENTFGKFICFEAPFLQAVLNGGFTLEPVSFLNSENHYPFISLSEERFNKLKTLADDMKECQEEKPVFYDMIRCQLWQFIFLAEKEFILNGNKGRNPEVKNHLSDFINLVNRFYHSNRDTWFYADKLNISPNYLNKISREKLGMSARDYIFNRIMSEAKVLLRLTKINVNELAYRLGFDDPNYFIRCFKKCEGMTPGEYQSRGTL